MKTLLELAKAELRYNEETKAIELIWKEKYDETTYKTALNKGFDFMQEYKAERWLSDIRNEGVVSPANAQWMQQEIMPKAISYGLKKIAVVIKPDIFQEFYIKTISRKAEKGKQSIKYFDNIEDANYWLRKN